MKNNIWLLFATLLSFFSVFFINREEINVDFNRYIDISIAAILLMIFLTMVVLKKIPKKYLILYGLIFLTTLPPLFINGLFNIHWLYLIFFFEILRTKYLPSKVGLNTICILSLISALIQMYIFRAADARPVLSMGDPNYSSYYMMLLLSILYYSHLKLLFIISSIITGLMISRTFYVWLFTFIVLNLIKKIISKYDFIKSRLIFLFAIFLLPVVLSLVFLELNPDPSVIYTSNYSRIFEYTDKSNIDRSLATINYIVHSYRELHTIFSGNIISEYTETVFYNTPHVSVYQTIFNYGILFLFLELYIFNIFFKINIFNDDFFIFIISLTIWMIFLGGVLFGPQLIILAIIMNKSLLFTFGKSYVKK